jgi:hypothetical protein
MGKGCAPRKGHDPKKQAKNYDDIDWSKNPKDRKVNVRVNGKIVNGD